MKGYFRKRGKTWSYTVDIGVDPITGKRRQKTKNGFKTKRDAQKAVAQLEYEMAAGTFVQENQILFKDFAQGWLKIYSETVKVSSVRVRKHELGHLLHYFAHLKLKDISKSAYQNMLWDLKRRGFKSTTISGIHTTGRMIFRKAMEQDMVKSNPTEYAQIPRETKTVEDIENQSDEIKYLEKDELVLFLKTAQEKGLDKDYIIFATLAYSGMRVGELLALKWKDIDFETNTISVTKTYYNPNNNLKKFQLLPPKTDGSIRDIEMDDLIMESLRKHRLQQREHQMRIGPHYHDQDFVFANDQGYPEYVKKVENRMSRLLRLAELNENLTPHSLRHTHTSLLAEAGVGLQETMERLGHMDDATTKHIYMHVTKTMKKEASQKFGELMKNLQN